MENTTNNPAPSLTITDLVSIKNIIEVASERGSFRANELKSVGEVYERLDAFLTMVQAVAEAEQSTNSQGESQ